MTQEQQRPYKPGDVANGHQLGQDGVWRPVAPPAAGGRDTIAPAVAAPSPKRWGWVVPVATGVLALLIGIGIGAAGGGSTEEGEETVPRAQWVESQDGLRDVRSELAALKADNQLQAADLKQREDAVAAKEAELAAREQAVTATEQQVATSTISDGTWVVGVDVEPGTYRAEGVSADCYWAILRSGTNGADIIQNDLPGGGNPSVTLEAGQDFSSQRCGAWTKTG